MRGREESRSREDVDRAYAFVVGQSRFRRANNPLPQLVLTVRRQKYASSSASRVIYHNANVAVAMNDTLLKINCTLLAPKPAPLPWFRLAPDTALK